MEIFGKKFIKNNIDSCIGKSRYPSIERAHKSRKRATKERGILLRVYKCPICNGWHLTSKNVTSKFKEEF